MKNKLITVLTLTLLFFGVSNAYTQQVQDYLNKKEYEYYDFYTGKKPTGPQNLFLYIDNQYTYRSLVFENMTQKEVTISYFIYFYDGSVLGPRTITLMKYNACNNDHIHTDSFIGGPEIVGVVPASVFSVSSGSSGSLPYAGSSNPFANAISSINGITSITIPNGVKYILEDAFRNNPSLLTIEIPSNIEFRDHAFYDCPKLSNVKIGKNITFYPGTDPNEVFSNNFWKAYEANGKAAGLYVLLSNGEWRYYP